MRRFLSMLGVAAATVPVVIAVPVLARPATARSDSKAGVRRHITGGRGKRMSASNSIGYIEEEGIRLRAEPARDACFKVVRRETEMDY